MSNQPLLTHGAEKAQGAAAAALAPGPYLALDEDKTGNTNNERRCPENDAHVDESKYRKICFSSIRCKLFWWVSLTPLKIGRPPRLASYSIRRIGEVGDESL